jgi:hypothetical protein
MSIVRFCFQGNPGGSASAVDRAVLERRREISQINEHILKLDEFIQTSLKLMVEYSDNAVGMCL